MPTNVPSHPTLVIGFGSTLRGDDGAGPAAAERIEAKQIQGVHVIACHQLTPELADPVSRAQRVIFLDASIDLPEGEVRVSRLEPDAPHQLMAHVTSPGGLLQLSQSVFQASPEAWMVEIPVVEMGISETLSPEAEKAVNQAVEKVVELISQAGT
jgi:hydrogenase maturation protease